MWAVISFAGLKRKGKAKFDVLEPPNHHAAQPVQREETGPDKTGQWVQNAEESFLGSWQLEGKS